MRILPLRPLECSVILTNIVHNNLKTLDLHLVCLMERSHFPVFFLFGANLNECAIVINVIITYVVKIIMERLRRDASHYTWLGMYWIPFLSFIR